AGATAAVEKKRRDHRTFGPTVTKGVSLRWVAVTDTAFVDPGYYDDAGTAEAVAYWGVSGLGKGWQFGVTASAGGGVMYTNEGPGVTTDQRYDAQGYFRGEVVATARRTFDRNWSVAFRGYAGAAVAD